MSEYSAHYITQGIVPFHLSEMHQVGPFLVNCYRVIILAEGLILFWNTFKEQDNAYATILSIISLSLATNLNDVLYHMGTKDHFQSYVDMSNSFQLVLAALGIAVCFLCRDRRKN